MTLLSRTPDDTPRRRALDATYAVAPSAGGGAVAWAGALGRKLGELARSDGHALICSPATRPSRFVQALACRCGIRVESVSNRFLEGDDRLGPGEIARLVQLGWLPPGDEAHPNWWRHLDLPAPPPGALHPAALAELLLATLLDVHDVSVHEEIEVEVFAAPCRRCTTSLER